MDYKITKKNILLFLYIFLYFLYFAVQDSVIKWHNSKIIIIISMLPALIILFRYGRFKTKTIPIYILASLIILFSFYQCGYTDAKFLLLFITGIVIVGYDNDIVFKTLLISKLLAIVFIFMFGGFNHRNGVGSNFGTLILLVCVILEQKYRNKFLIFTFVLISIISLAYLNPENSGVIVILMVFLILYLCKNTKMISRFLSSKLVTCIYPICFLGNLFLSLSVYSKEIPMIGKFLPSILNEKLINIINHINIVLGTRLSLAKTALTEIPIAFFGGKEFTSKYNFLLNDASLNRKYFLVDSGYILLILKFGIFPLMLFMIFSFLSINYLRKNNSQILVLLSICFALWGILEDNLFFGFTMFFWAKGLELLFEKNHGGFD